MTKRLYRSRKHNIIAGVAGGLGEYLDIDPVLIRIVFVVTAFFGGSGLLAYIIAWIIMPEAPREQTMDASATTPQSSPEQPPVEPQQTPEPTGERRGSVVGGLILICLGLLFLADNFIPRFHFWDYWPLILVAIGAGLLYRSVRTTNS